MSLHVLKCDQMIRKTKLYFLLFFFVIISCNRANFEKKTTEEKTLFTLVSKSTTHVDFTNSVQQTNEFNCLNYTYALKKAAAKTSILWFFRRA